MSALHPVFADICAGIQAQHQVAGRAQYEAALRSFDWTYEFSDDLQVYRRGCRALRDLHAMQAQVDPTGDLWLSIAPQGHGVPQPIVQGA